MCGVSILTLSIQASRLSLRHYNTAESDSRFRHHYCPLHCSLIGQWSRRNWSGLVWVFRVGSDLSLRKDSTLFADKVCLGKAHSSIHNYFIGKVSYAVSFKRKMGFPRQHSSAKQTTTTVYTTRNSSCSPAAPTLACSTAKMLPACVFNTHSHRLTP